MPRTTIPLFRFAQAFADARLDDIRKETHGKHTDLILDFRALRLSPETAVVKEERVLAEHVRGAFVPYRVRFVDVTLKYLSGEFLNLNQVPAEHPARILLGMLTWRQTGDKSPSYRLFNGAAEADLWFTAKSCVSETIDAPIEPADFIRTHSPAPPLNPGRVPHYPVVNRRFGGNPVTIHLGPRASPRQLFVGGLDIQPDQRPDVDAVLNLGEKSSRWLIPDESPVILNDRWVEMGEGSAGMSGEGIKAEAAWVIKWLQKNRRVLVHCVAGFNRSVTVCAAVLILLEGLTPEAALARIREHHAWAKPDPVHWLRLKGLGFIK